MTIPGTSAVPGGISTLQIQRGPEYQGFFEDVRKKTPKPGGVFRGIEHATLRVRAQMKDADRRRYVEAR